MVCPEDLRQTSGPKKTQEWPGHKGSGRVTKSRRAPKKAREEGKGQNRGKAL